MTASTISPQVKAIVLQRDGYHCIAPDIDGKAGWCRDAFGTPITRWGSRDPGPMYLQMSHTKDADGLAMGKKAESDPRHLVSLCPFHHTGTSGGSNWEAVHRNQIRKWLAEMYDSKRRR
jgi:hypothetical protein